MYDAPQAPSALIPAPGARAARLCGIWSIVLGLTCVGLPIGIVLAIVALVQQAKAKRLAKESPELYEAPSATGLVTGIIGLVMVVVMLPFLGIVSAIAIPAMLGQRSRARDKAAVSQMVSHFGDLVNQYDKLVEEKVPQDQIGPKLDAYLRSTAGMERNPWMPPGGSAVAFHVDTTTGIAPEEAIVRVAKGRAVALGQAVYVLELPTDGHPGYLAGAVRIQSEVDGEHVVTKSAGLE
jgi:hypothetical protein